MEENPVFHNQIQNIIPKELKGYVEFNLSERVEKWYGPYLGCYYKDIPKYPYDFVFIDGPALRKNPDSPKCFSADFINLVRCTTNPVSGLLDQRVGTYWTYKRLMPSAKITYHPVKKLTSISKALKSDLLDEMALSPSRIPIQHERA